MMRFNFGFLTKKPIFFSGLGEEQMESIQSDLLSSDIMILGDRINQRTISKLNGNQIFKLSASTSIIDLTSGEILKKIEADATSKEDLRTALEDLFQKLLKKTMASI